MQSDAHLTKDNQAPEGDSQQDCQQHDDWTEGKGQHRSSYQVEDSL
jgi:hypothetical protein